MTEAELIVVLTEELRGLADQFVAVDYENAVDSAEMDTGWLLPQTSLFRIKWLKERGKRHLLSFLCDTSAYKFKYKNISLDQRFEHLFKRIQEMDKAFVAIMEEYSFEFTDVCPLTGVSSFDLFPHKIDAGFASESQTGKDLTYSEDNEVMVFPNESS